MSKNKRTVPAKPAQPVRTAAAPRPVQPATWPAFLTDIRLQSVVVFALAFLLYANTLGHEFTLDDSIVITDNMFTQEGVKGIPGILTKDTFFGFFKVEGKETLVSGGRYRPLTLVLFALLYQIVGASPMVFHFLTVLLYALTCLVLYRVLVRLVAGPAAGASAGVLTAFLAAVLFTVHPIHTEVVANVKGCDEIVTLLLCLLALDFSLRAYDSGRLQWALAAGGVFFLACLSKENAAAFVLIIPLALYTRQRVGATAAAGSSSIVASSWPIWAAFALFFLIRGSILGWRFGGEPMELMNNPFLKIENGQWVKFNANERWGTIFYTLGRYLQLLVWPHPLTHDYYPRHIGIKTMGDPLALLSALGHVALGLYGAFDLARRRGLVGLGILWYLLALSIVSNIVFPIGTNMGERFAFMPSAGFCLAAAVLLCRLGRPGWTTPVAIVGAAGAVFALLTISRNFDWSSNEKLFLTDVHASPNSAKIRNAAGGVLFDKARVEDDPEKRRLLAGQSLEHINKALEIYPNYKDAYITRGGDHFFLGNYTQAAADYRTALQFSPGDERLTQSLAIVLREAGKEAGEKRGDVAAADKLLREAWDINPKDAETARLLGVANGIQGKNADALLWFSRAVELDPKNASYLYDLGTATAIGGDVAKGEALRQQAIQMDPKLREKK